MKYPDRARFIHKLGQLVLIPERATPNQVLRALGKPDRIERNVYRQESDPNDEEAWSYGTDGPSGAATLVRLEFDLGRLVYLGSNPPAPPPWRLISEAELRRSMHVVLDGMPHDYRSSNKSNSIWLARTVNSLLPYGETRCKAIINEVGRVIEGFDVLDPRPFFLCYTLFDPPATPGFFDNFGPVWDWPDSPRGPKHPRWPVEIVDNVPIIRGEPGSLFGQAAPFTLVFKQLRDRIHLRKSPLSLPK